MANLYLQKNFKPLLLATNLLVAGLAIVTIIGGSLATLQNIEARASKGNKETFLYGIINSDAIHVADLNKEDIWRNLGIVLILIGSVTLICSCIGLLAAHKETSFVLVTFSMLMLICLMIHIVAMKTTNERNMLLYEKPRNILSIIAIISSSSILLLSLTLLVLFQKYKKELTTIVTL